MPALRRISRDFLAASGPTLGAGSLRRISRDFLAASGPTLGAGSVLRLLTLTVDQFKGGRSFWSVQSRSVDHYGAPLVCEPVFLLSAAGL